MCALIVGLLDAASGSVQPPISPVVRSPAVIRFSPSVAWVCRRCQGPCWVLGLQKRTPWIPSWPIGLMLAWDSGAPFPWGSPAL